MDRVWESGRGSPMTDQNEPNHRWLILGLACLLLLQVAGAWIWQKWFRHDSAGALSVIPHMQELTRERRYDDAINTGLGALKHSSADDTVLQQIALVFLRRAQIESGDKEQYAARAVGYAEKALAANPTNQADLYGTARVFDIAGDFSASRECEFYRRSIAIFQQRAPLLGGETILVAGKAVPTGPLRQENEHLLQRGKAKMAKAGCSAD